MKKVFLFFVLITICFAPAVVGAQDIFDSAKGSLNAVAPEGISTEANPSSLASGIVNTVVGILGVVAVGFIIYAGGLWLTAGGDENKVGTAKKILRQTVVGIIIVALAYSITRFVISFALA